MSNDAAFVPTDGGKAIYRLCENGFEITVITVARNPLMMNSWHCVFFDNGSGKLVSFLAWDNQLFETENTSIDRCKSTPTIINYSAVGEPHLFRGVMKLRMYSKKYNADGYIRIVRDERGTLSYNGDFFITEDLTHIDGPTTAFIETVGGMKFTALVVNKDSTTAPFIMSFTSSGPPNIDKPGAVIPEGLRPSALEPKISPIWPPYDDI